MENNTLNMWVDYTNKIKYQSESVQLRFDHLVLCLNEKECVESLPQEDNLSSFFNILRFWRLE